MEKKFKKKVTVDVITSAYNEEDCLPELFSRLRQVFVSEKSYSFRIIVMDNNSSDATWTLIKKEASKFKDVNAFRMSRNFTLDAAFTCGLDHATSDLAIIMTSDLQDPPEAIPLLLREYESGSEQVLVRIKSRESVPVLRRILSGVFYKIARKMTSGMLPESVSDFRLVNRKTYLAIRELRESHRFLRGLGSWVGFKTSYVEIDRPPRFAGESKWVGMSLLKVISHASRSILAYSATPLMFVSFMGVTFSILSFLGVFVSAIVWITSGVPFAGYGTIVGLIALGFSLTMLAIGILAQYLALIYEEVKRRPLYIISEKIT
jgi:glycosyltransferase involved in cell wall biosynthesis